MKTIPNQILAGTRIDAHGERNTREALEAFAGMYAGKRMPLNQQHDLSLRTAGYVTDLHVVEDKSSPGNWSLVGNVHYDGEAVVIPIGGFSISFLETLRASSAQELFQIFLPYPHYNNENLLDELFVDGYVSVGRWAKKSIDPESVALISSVAIALLTPLWDSTFKDKIAPSIADFFSKHFPKLKNKNIHADFVQYISYTGNPVQVLFIPTRGEEAHCFQIQKTAAAMLMVHEHLVSLDLNHVRVAKVFLRFNKKTDSFALFRIEYADGTVAEGA